MQKLLGIATVCVLAQTFSVQAQQTAVFTHEWREYYRAVDLYREQQYLSAQTLFKNTLESTQNADIKADCDFYIALCAIRLNQSNGDVLMERFIADHPTSAKHNLAYVEVSNFYFEEGNYPQALQWLEKIRVEQLTTDQRERYFFQKGYAHFKAEQKGEAIDHLNRVVNSQKFGSQAKYYIGFINYQDDNYTDASQYFDQVSDDKKYKEKMAYYQADMNFKLGKFENAIELGTSAMAKADAQEKSELNKIIGESHFNLGAYDKAIPFLKQYKGKKGKWSNTDFYLLGYAYYKQGDYENAISQFNKIIDGSDLVAQNAYYHLGESYLKTNRKTQALNAFKNASEMDFDLKIQEDAFLNYAKLSYENGNPYMSVPDVLTAFMKKYPNSPAKNEMEGLLINSFVTSRNYKEALVLLEKSKSYQNRNIYQKVAFYRGLEVYIDGDYATALELFRKSLTVPNDPVFTARAHFWKGETEFQTEQFKEALLSFRQFEQSAEASKTPEYANFQYNLGYTYFKLKDYASAVQAFTAFSQKKSPDASRLNDAYLRLGDSHFVQAQYWPAMEAYNKAIAMRGIDADYAAFQKAISYGFVQRVDKKIEDLNAFIKNFPKSQYRDDALFELAGTYTNENKDELALKTYDQLIKEFKDGSFTARAILRQGVIYYNKNQTAPALEKFKIVAAQYPRTPEALEAVSTARQIYIDTGRVDAYADWVKTLDYVEVSDQDLDNTSYESAEKMYLQNNFKAAISGFTNYLSRFPNGMHSLKAHFYLGQLYFADGLENNAIDHYEFVISKRRSEFTEQALARLSEIYLKKKDNANAIPVLLRLEQEADFPQNRIFAQSNLMKVFYEQEDFAQAVAYADKVLALSKLDDRVRGDAQIIVARSAFKTGNLSKAKEAYQRLLNTAKGELAAEALYYDAFFKNAESKYEASNQSVQKLTKEFATYRYFIAKGLLLMAKNNYALQDSFNAIVILEHLQKNVTEFPDVVAETEETLRQIRAEEAKRNSSLRNQ